ncbi:MAG: prepilin peptidase [Lachnospiraceae bacterium]|nr:prepilin peptidase [Lachnospiraceae bacterium]
MIHAIMITFLGMLSFYDFRERRLPICVVVGFFVCGGVTALLGTKLLYVDMLVGLAIGLLIILISCFTRGQIGMGDGLMFMAIGVSVGGKVGMTILMLSLLLVCVVAIALLVTRQIKKGDRLPFAPFVLCAYIGQLLLG